VKFPVAHRPGSSDDPSVGGELSAAIVASVGIALSPLPLVLAVALVGPDGLVTRATTFVSGEALAVGAVCAAAVFVLQSDEAMPACQGQSRCSRSL